MSVYEPSSPDVNKWRSDAELVPHDDAFHGDELPPDIELRNTIFKVVACLGGLAVVSVLFLIF